MNWNTPDTEKLKFEARLDLLTASYVALGLENPAARRAALADLLLFNAKFELSLAA